MPGDSTDCPWTDGSTRPLRAPVPPRVYAGGKASLSLEQVIRPYLGQVGIVQITGAAGSGKSTALDHLLAVFSSEAIDAIDNVMAMPPQPRGKLLIIASSLPLAGSYLATFEMASWGFDDCVSYLANVHHDKCKSVLDRLSLDESSRQLEGNPRLIRIVLDEMAVDESLQTSSAALIKHLGQRLSPSQRRGLAGMCLSAMVNNSVGVEASGLESFHDPRIADLLRHSFVRVLLAAEHIAEKLAAHAHTEELVQPLSREFVHEIAYAIRVRRAARDRLNDFINGRDRRFDAMAASILLADDPDWRPKSGQGLILRGALLADAKWANINLQGADLTGADLSHADLTSAHLGNVKASGASFLSTCLHKAVLDNGTFFETDLTLADLSCCSAQDSDFTNAQFEAANCQNAQLDRSNFYRANLKLASFARASLEFCRLSATELADADFGDAQLAGACLIRVRMLDATWQGASFAAAQLDHCDLEGLHLAGANFTGANLTGSDLTGTVMPHVNFEGASLVSTGLADVDWASANLTKADLTGASFYMGSSRSGLVGSVIPSEGSRTGFYTDDYNDQDFKSPEEIRKANLCGANLIDAKIDKTDFYLVDLRGARYSREQASHLQRTGAILRQRC